MRVHQLISSGLVALSIVACGDDGGDEPTGGTGGEYVYDAAIMCPDFVPEMAINMKATGDGGEIVGHLVDADKIPVGWYHNDWVVRFTGPGDAPLREITLKFAETFMPSHGHDGGQTPDIETSSDGNFSVTGLNVNMNGHWEFRFDVEAMNGDGEVVAERVTFDVCNEQPEP
jgi:hypothetical protein